MYYNIKTGVTRAKSRAKHFLLAAVALAVPAAFVLSIGGASAAPVFTLTPWTYVGAVGDCGPGYPAGTPGNVVSKWDYTTGNPSPSLYLQKSALQTDCSSAGATVNGVEGITLTELNYQYKTGEYCGGGAARYNVVTSDDVTHFFGCNTGTQTPVAGGWTEVTWDVTNPAQAFPVIAPGTTVKSIDVVFDEQGSTHLDNFSINNQIIGGPATPASKDACKNDGWKTLQDSNGVAFKNQGDCVSFAATGGKNLAGKK